MKSADYFRSNPAHRHANTNKRSITFVGGCNRIVDSRQRHNTVNSGTVLHGVTSVCPESVMYSAGAAWPHTGDFLLLIFIFYKIVLEVQQRKLKIKNDSTKHMTITVQF